MRQAWLLVLVRIVPRDATLGPLDKPKARDFRRVTPNMPTPPLKPGSRSEKKSPSCLNGGVGQGAVGAIGRPFGGSRNDRFWGCGTVISSLGRPAAPAVNSDDDDGGTRPCTTLYDPAPRADLGTGRFR